MTIFVKDYVALPCDDASEGIRRAVADAKRLGADEISFEVGVYNLKTPIKIATDQSAHDAGATLTAEKEVLILIEDMQNLTISGKTDENGEPATLLAGMNTMELHSIQPSILWCERCENLRVKDIAFTRAPEFASAGRVVKNDGKRITVQVLDGCPCYDGMGTYCMNRFTPDGELRYESLSYGPGLGTTFSLVGDMTLELDSEKIASKVCEGDLISWHQGARTDFQCFFGRIKGLSLSNLRTYNSNGFAMIAFECKNITADRVVFKPRGNQLFTAPRDAWKLHKCSGRIENSHFYVEGVRMDGQNVHNNYMFVREILSDKSIIVESENAEVDFSVSGGEESNIEFYSDEELVGKAKLSGYAHIDTLTENGRNFQLYRLDFSEPLGFAVNKRTLLLASCFAPELYHCHDSEFRNVAGAGHLLRISHALIERCRYTNMMNAGIMLGAEFPTHHEGGNCEDILIRDCEFKNCGFAARYGTVGCIGINSSGFHKAVNHGIKIESCRFSDSDVGVDIHCAKEIVISGCSYERLGRDVRLN